VFSPKYLDGNGKIKISSIGQVSKFSAKNLGVNNEKLRISFDQD